MSDGKQIVENVAPEILSDAVGAGKAPITRETIAKAIVEKDKAEKDAPEKKVPEGCVVRNLTMRDRNLIIGACRTYIRGENKGKHKNQFKVDRILKVLLEQETVDYFLMINDSQAENLFKWQEARQAYVSFRMMKGGMVKTEEFAKSFPDVDVDECPPKPSLKQPELTKDDQRGPAREFYIPAKLDTFIEEALRDMEWGAVGSEQVVELLQKYSIED